MEVRSNDTEILNFVEKNVPGTKFKISWDGQTEISYVDGVYIIARNVGSVPEGTPHFRGWSNHGYNTRKTKLFYKIADLEDYRDRSRSRSRSHSRSRSRDRDKKSRSKNDRGRFGYGGKKRSRVNRKGRKTRRQRK